MKRTITGVLAIAVLVLFVWGVGRMLERGNRMDDSCFTIEEQTITGYNTGCGTEVYVNSKINGTEIKTIGEEVFSGIGLTSVEIEKGIENIEYRAFYNNLITKLVIPETVINIADEVFNLNNLSDDSAYIYQRTSEGVDKTTLIGYAGVNKDLTIPNEVKTIGSNALTNLSLNSITLNDGLEKIETGAFLNNNLTTIEIPSTVTYVGELALTNNNFTSIIVKGKTGLEQFELFDYSVMDKVVYE